MNAHRRQRLSAVLEAEGLDAIIGTTTENVYYVSGLRSISLEQSLAGRLLGYGTLHAGPLEVEHLPHARQARDLVERLAS